MARVPMVTRTIETTKVTALCVDIATQTPYNAEFTLSSTYKDDRHLLKALEKVVNDDVHKVVHVISSSIEETLYGMTEQDFITYAKVLPPRKSND